MKQLHTKSRKSAGFTVLTALAFTIVVGTLLAGVGTVATSHYQRSRVEGTYANAIAVAEAGINYELAKISSNITNPSLADQSTPGTGSVGGGNYSVYVRPWGSNCNGTVGTWAPPMDMCVESTGTVGGISRTVRVRGVSMSVFGEYAIYAYNSATFNGGGASDKTGTNGNMGSNGTVTFHGTQGSEMVDQMLSLNGSPATTNSDDGNVAHNPDAVMFPTVLQIANSTFTGGFSWLATHNANATIKILPSGDPTLASEPTISGLTLSDVNTKLASAGFTVNTRTLKNAAAAITKDTSNLDVGNVSGYRFAMPASSGYSDQVDAKNKKIYFFPPGDYYFSDLDLAADACVFLTHLGQVRIWIDSNSGGTDDISKNYYIFTDPNPSKFRLYYNKCGQIKMRGHAYFHGSIYGIKAGCSGGTPELNEAGGDAVFGSVIMSYFTISGGSQVVFPNNGGSASNDPALWFGFKDSWKEVPVNNGSNPVFADGTSN